MSNTTPVVSVIMGSKSDLPVMQEATKQLEDFGVPYEMKVVSAHRTPEAMIDHAKNCEARGIRVIIAGAGGAAHLPGMVASASNCPVIGVPVLSSNSLQGWDSLLSIAQMPKGVPVATVAVNGAANAGILAVQMLATGDEGLRKKLQAFKDSLAEMVKQQNQDIS